MTYKRYIISDILASFFILYCRFNMLPMFLVMQHNHCFLELQIVFDSINRFCLHRTCNFLCSFFLILNCVFLFLQIVTLNCLWGSFWSFISLTSPTGTLFSFSYPPRLFPSFFLSFLLLWYLVFCPLKKQAYIFRICRLISADFQKLTNPGT